ncbi:sulfotransferase family protein [Tabrizicola sp. J26]|uniref:sulfotransferase family 2 domain-containing protein n=1 Tax=Alitabrizicola rongguiensis TaxID=2909234 RepID=UPI001F29F00A|nr:sulfotransferase family 2 domain-containing protein [Tabrizicola rongguiensis]MCF1708737.1 sulfotransferase family protein [Tabrizicola rongguiensis]
MDLIQHPIVFLHLPKTAGQTVHNALAAALRNQHVSPIRVHSHAEGSRQFPPGYALYSGHLDMAEAGHLPRGRFTFTILRDPRERIASFWLYLRRDSLRLDPAQLALPSNIGRRRALDWTAEDYFFSGDAAWQTFIRDHYDNFYCGYFGTGRFRGGAAIRSLTAHTAIARAREGLAALDGVFATHDLRPLEAALAERYGLTVRFDTRKDNAADLGPETRRWPILLDALGSDAARRRIESFVDRDEALLAPRHAWT